MNLHVEKYLQMLLLINLAKSLNIKSEVGKNKVSKEYIKKKKKKRTPQRSLAPFQH